VIARHRAAGAAPRRLLLVHPGALGDLLQALPAFGRARGAFPDARLTLLTGDPYADVARATGLFDDVRVFPAAAAYRGSPAGRARALAALVAAARAAAPDRAAVFKAAPVFALAARLSGAAVCVGAARGVGARLLATPLPVDPSRHREDRYDDVVRALGVADGIRPVAPRWPEHAPPAAIASLRGSSPERGALVGLAPGGARNVTAEMPERRWPAARYGELAAAVWRASPGVGFVLLGGAADSVEAAVARDAAVAGGVPADRLIDLSGRTSVLEARAAVAALDLVVAHDAGLMHVAATTATPLVLVFGPTDPRVAAPRGPNVRVLWEPSGPVACHDEATGALRPCGRDGACCTSRVPPAAVADVVLATLRAAEPGGTR
jgi:ADP-heptose:LPS heptosyltransferase